MIQIINPIKDKTTWEVFQNLYPTGFQPANCTWNLVGAVDEENRAVGGMGFIEEINRYVITWLYVTDDLLRNSIATDMVDWFLNYIGSDLKDVEVDFTNLEDGVKEFFEQRQDFEVRKMSTTYRITFRQLQDSNMIEEAKKSGNEKASSNKTEDFLKLPAGKRGRMYQRLKEQGMFFVDDMENFEKRCESRLCMCIHEGQDITSLILTNYVEKDDYEISFIYSEDPVNLSILLPVYVDRFVKDFPGCNLLINPQTEKSQKLVDYFFPEKEKEFDNYLAEWTF